MGQERALCGLGVAWRSAVARLLVERATGGQLGFAEVIAENTDPEDLDPDLAALVDLGVPVVPHGVTLGLAGAHRPDERQLARLGELALRLGSPVVSEHVAFVRTATSPDPRHPDALEAGHLLPPPRTRGSLEVLCENVRSAQAALPVPLALENIASMLVWPEDEYTEPDFLAELVERTGVDLVLDVSNLFASATARHTDPVAELQRFPLHAVSYVHVAGGRFEDTWYVDTHAHDMVAPVLDLLRRAAALLGPTAGIMLERDANVSEATMRPQLAVLDSLMRGVDHVSR